MLRLSLEVGLGSLKFSADTLFTHRPLEFGKDPEHCNDLTK